MNVSFYIILAFLLSAVSSAYILPRVLRMCHRNGIYDIPSLRKVHKSKIPRIGGIVFVPTTAIGMTLTLMLYVETTDVADTIKTGTLFLGVGLLFIYLVGLLDDFFGLSANFKFGVQFVTAMAYPIVGLYLDNLYGLLGIYELNRTVAYILTVFLVMFVVNSVNTIDGIDGLCSGLSVIALSVYCYFFYSIHNYIFCFFCAALIGSIVVFMFYNLHGNPERGTKTFMGDCGSLMLGYTLSYLGLKLSVSNELIPPPEEGILIPLSVLLIPTFDLVRVAIGRILKGIHPFHPDKTHIHHLLMFNGFSQRATLIILLFADFVVIALNMTLFNIGIQVSWIVMLDIAIYAVSVWVLYRSLPASSLEQIQMTYTYNDEPIIRQEKGQIKSYAHPDFSDSEIKVSIIVATYNSASTITDTLESILRQTYQSFEVILCDGLSKDNTLQIVEGYRERFGVRMRVYSEADKGIYDAMNKGIMRATGDVVGILNSDDFYTSDDVLERIVETFKGVPLLEAVYGDVHYVKPNNLKRTVRYYSSRWFRPRYMRMGFMPAHPSFYCLKELYATYGLYRLDYSIAADFDQLFRLLFVHRIRALYIHKDFVTMRTGGASNSGLKSHLQIVRDHAKAIRSYGYQVSYTLFSIRYIYKTFEVLCGRIGNLFR